MSEIIPACKIPSGVGARCFRFLEINQLAVGEAVFVSDDEVGSRIVDPGHRMRMLAYQRARMLGRKFRTQRGFHRDQRGTFIERTK